MSTVSEQQLALALEAMNQQTQACKALMESITEDMAALALHFGEHEQILVNKASTYALTNLGTTVNIALDNKSDQQWVIDQLGTKVDQLTINDTISVINNNVSERAKITDVNAALVLKADLNNTTAALDLKSSITWVQEQLDLYTTTVDMNMLLDEKADLVAGKIPAHQLPSFVDDVLSYPTQTGFPTTGVEGKIYVSEADNTTYRWSGTAYVAVGSSLGLGETSTTAYRGDRGKVSYDHAVSAHAVQNAQQNVQSDWDAPSGDAFIRNKPAEFPPETHTHTPSEVSLGNLPNAKSDAVNSASSDQLATSLAAKTAYDRGNAAHSIASAATTSLATKANTTDVNAALALKANTSALALKADITAMNLKAATTWVQAQLNLKANLSLLTTINNRLASLESTAASHNATLVSLTNQVNAINSTLNTSPSLATIKNWYTTSTYNEPNG